MNTQSIIIKTINLTFGFNKTRNVVDTLNLKVPEKSIYGFLGPNGAGKTTTIRLLLGLLKSKSESVYLFNNDIQKNPIQVFSRIGSLIEQPSLYEHLPAIDNLKIAGLMKNAKKGRIDEVLEIVKLKSFKKQKVKEYSLGMKQRLGLAIALLNDPELLILDEPTNGLDPRGIIEMRELILELNRNYGKTIFLSSHLLSEIEKLCTRVGVINKGKLLFQGTITELTNFRQNKSLIQIQTNNIPQTIQLLEPEYSIESNNQQHILVHYKSNNQIAQICKQLIENKIDIYEIKLISDNLEDAFIELTENIE